MKKELIKRGLIGIGFGNIISCIILFLICTIQKTTSLEVSMVLRSTIAASVIGFVFAGASLLLENEKISLLKATIFHFLCLFITYYLMAFFGTWLVFEVKEILISVTIFIGTYICIWLGVYFTLKRKVKKMNEKLNKNA